MDGHTVADLTREEKLKYITKLETAQSIYSAAADSTKGILVSFGNALLKGLLDQQKQSKLRIAIERIAINGKEEERLIVQQFFPNYTRVFRPRQRVSYAGWQGSSRTKKKETPKKRSTVSIATVICSTPDSHVVAGAVDNEPPSYESPSPLDDDNGNNDNGNRGRQRVPTKVADSSRPKKSKNLTKSAAYVAPAPVAPVAGSTLDAPVVAVADSPSHNGSGQQNSESPVVANEDNECKGVPEPPLHEDNAFEKQVFEFPLDASARLRVKQDEILKLGRTFLLDAKEPFLLGQLAKSIAFTFLVSNVPFSSGMMSRESLKAHSIEVLKTKYNLTDNDVIAKLDGWLEHIPHFEWISHDNIAVQFLENSPKERILNFIRKAMAEAEEIKSTEPGSESKQGSKVVMTQDDLDILREVLVGRLRQHAETQSGEGMRQRDLIQWYVEQTCSTMEEASSEVTKLRAVIEILITKEDCLIVIDEADGRKTRLDRLLAVSPGYE